MSPGVFDIYQTSGGYTAVDNETQRQILAALLEGEKQLPELMDITGKSKPTLSAIHVKELLARGLIEEHPHPTDGRRKIYRLAGQRIGASDERPPLPPAEGIQRPSERVPLRAVLQILAAAPGGSAPEVLHAQGRRLGETVGSTLRVGDRRDLWMRLVRWFEEQGVATLARFDLDADEYHLDVMDGLPATKAVAAALAGVAEGVAAVRTLPIEVRGYLTDGRIVLRAVA